MLLTLGEYAGRLVEQGVDGEGLLQVPPTCFTSTEVQIPTPEDAEGQN